MHSSMTHISHLLTLTISTALPLGLVPGYRPGLHSLVGDQPIVEFGIFLSLLTTLTRITFGWFQFTFLVFGRAWTFVAQDDLGFYSFLRLQLSPGVDQGCHLLLNFEIDPSHFFRRLWLLRALLFGFRRLGPLGWMSA